MFGNFNQLLKLKAAHPNLRIEISIGGWTGSKWFSDVAATPASRRAFVQSCLDLFIRGNLPHDPVNIWPPQSGGAGVIAGLFDGINIDWEYPGIDPGNGAHFSAGDRHNATQLLKEFRRQLDEYGESTGKHYLLTVDIPGGNVNSSGSWELHQVADTVDWIDVMTLRLPRELGSDHRLQLAVHVRPSARVASAAERRVRADPARRRRQRLRALPPHGRAARAAEGAGRVGAPRRAALPDGAPVVGALAEARLGRGRGGDAARRRARPRRGEPAAAARERVRSSYVDGFLEHLELMSPWEYQDVRRVLGHGSGFDSPGFREIRRVSPPLLDAFDALRRERGLSLLEVYMRGREHEELYQLAER